MKGLAPEVWLALATVLAAIATGFAGMKAAGRTAQPSAQDAINAGFTALTQRQLDELVNLRTDVNELKATHKQQAARIEELEDHVDAQDDRERAFKHIIRLLLNHLDGVYKTLENAGLPVPQEPVDRREIEGLLAQKPLPDPNRKER